MPDFEMSLLEKLIFKHLKDVRPGSRNLSYDQMKEVMRRVTNDYRELGMSETTVRKLTSDEFLDGITLTRLGLNVKKG